MQRTSHWQCSILVPLTSFLSSWSPMLWQTTASSCSLRWPLLPTPSASQMLRTWLSGVSKKGLQDFWGFTETSESQVGSWPEAEKATGKPSAPDAGATYLPVIYSEIRWTDRWTQVSSKAPKVESRWWVHVQSQYNFSNFILHLQICKIKLLLGVGRRISALCGESFFWRDPTSVTPLKAYKRGLRYLYLQLRKKFLKN